MEEVEHFNKTENQKDVLKKPLDKALYAKINDELPIKELPYTQTTPEQRDNLRELSSNFNDIIPEKDTIPNVEKPTMTPCVINHEVFKNDLNLLYALERKIEIKLPVDDPSSQGGVKIISINPNDVNFCLICKEKI